MTSFKNLAILILGCALLQATLASTHCNVQLFKNSLNDGDQDHLYRYFIQDVPDFLNAPFNGMSGQLYDENLEERTVSSFRVLVVDLGECGSCTVVGYSGKNLGGKKSEHFVDWRGDNGQVDFDFCVKSYTLDCEANHVEEEEEEEEELSEE